MKKYILLLGCLFLITGCGVQKNAELDQYEKDYIEAIAVFKGLMNYEYDFTLTEGDAVTNRNIKYNKQGEFAVIQDPAIEMVTNEDGTTSLPKNAISYFDTQTSKYVTYDTECGRGWVYKPIKLTDDNKYGPYTQFLALANSEKITSFKDGLYTLEFNSTDVTDAISNNQFTYDGKITMEVTISDKLFKDVTIKFGDVKTVKLNFKDYANVEVLMEAEAQDAKHFTGTC